MWVFEVCVYVRERERERPAECVFELDVSMRVCMWLCARVCVCVEGGTGC